MGRKEGMEGAAWDDGLIGTIGFLKGKVKNKDNRN
jgi:hypothetical protein